jgi:hypothetical protein
MAYGPADSPSRICDANSLLLEHRATVLFAEMDYKEGGKVRRASRLEVDIRTFAAKAVKGDVASAMLLLKMRTHAEKYGDGGPIVIRIINALPPSRFVIEKKLRD